MECCAMNESGKHFYGSFTVKFVCILNIKVNNNFLFICQCRSQIKKNSSKMELNLKKIEKDMIISIAMHFCAIRIQTSFVVSRLINEI